LEYLPASVGQNSFYRDTESADCLITAENPRSLECPNRNGFTLVEIVVSLCIVAILAAIAVPGFKKATEDFRLNATLEDTLDILKACRAYYLIFNEFPPDCSDNIPDKLCPFVPSRLIDPRPSQGSLHRWNCRPLGKTAYNYDLENFMTNGDPGVKPHSVGVALIGVREGTADWNKCYLKFRTMIEGKYIINRNNNRMACFSPECPGSIDLNSNTLWENRYY
jgi:prepilin-type N-terminal cleavage/methylation domain-containing protein